MSRYLILVLLNVPLVLAGMLEALVEYKLRRISRKSFIMQVLIWSAIVAGLAVAYPAYQYLFSKRLTVSEPLSLFDVVEITFIIFILFIANRSRVRLENLEHRVKMLHQELSISLSVLGPSTPLSAKQNSGAMASSHDKLDEMTTKNLDYFAPDTIKPASGAKIFISRLAFPLLCLLSRDQSLRLGLVPIDDERVVQAMKEAKGRVLDIGCGANNFVRSYGNGVGVDVANWKGCDVVIKDAAKLPFNDGEFDTVSYLACLNHIPNRDDSVKEAYRVTKPGGKLIVTMITPHMGKFIHWLRFRNDPDHKERHLDHDHELMGMSPQHVRSIVTAAGFKAIKRRRFVFGLNNIYTALK